MTGKVQKRQEINRMVAKAAESSGRFCANTHADIVTKLCCATRKVGFGLGLSIYKCSYSGVLCPYENYVQIQRPYKSGVYNQY